MIKKMYVSGFKCFRDLQEACLAPITLIYGPNSSGKSTMIQALLAMKQSWVLNDTRGKSIIERGPYINLGAFPAYANGLNVCFGLEFDGRNNGVTETLIQNYLIDRDEDGPNYYSYPNRESREYKITENSNTSRFSVSDRGLNLKTAIDKVNELWLNLSNSPEQNDFNKWTAFINNFKQSMKEEGPSYEEFLAKRIEYMSDEEKHKINSNFSDWNSLLAEVNNHHFHISREGNRQVVTPITRINEIENKFSEAMRNLVYLKADRQPPRRYYEYTQDSSVSELDSNGGNIFNILFDHKKILETINGYLDFLETNYKLNFYEITPEEPWYKFDRIFAPYFTDNRNDHEVSVADVGLGVSHLLPVLYHLFSQEARILAIETPEAHLHPRLQAKLGDLFIDAIETKQNTTTTKQIIVETHSEMLILRLQRRIREGKLSVNDLSVLYVDPTGDQGSRIVPIELDSMGNLISPWPGGFFDESYKELFGGDLTC